uniref:Uncharacterized protein n=1 Tax=Sciurus vulgaris TaxID=55149 RepID=A0A8D2DIQ8_SCIVU
MWEIRELEKEMDAAYQGTKGKCCPAVQVGCVVMVLMKKVRETAGGQRMKLLGCRKMIFFLKATSWNKKLYDYEANMLDRWGHRGYKGLYPEEIETDSDQQDIINGEKPSPQVKSSSHESCKRKKSRKSHRMKQKKDQTHTHTKKKKKEEEKKQEGSQRCNSRFLKFSKETGASSARKRKQPHKSKKKSRKKSLKKSALFVGAESDTSQSDASASSSSEDSEERDTENQKEKKRYKCKRTNKCTNWKVASAESVEDIYSKVKNPES